MAKYLITRWHSNDAKGFGKIKPDINPRLLVERLQAERRGVGRPDGLTWQVHDGDLVSAMIATARL